MIQKEAISEYDEEKGRHINCYSVQDARVASEKIMKFFSPLLFGLGQSEVLLDPEAGQ